MNKKIRILKELKSLSNMGNYRYLILISQSIHSDLVESIWCFKKFHLRLSDELCNPSKWAKRHSSIFKAFVNGKNAPLISLLLLNQKLFTNVQAKAKFLLIYFFTNGNIMSNDNILPLMPTYYTNNRLNCICFNHEKKLKVIQSLDTNGDEYTVLLV